MCVYVCLAWLYICMCLCDLPIYIVRSNIPEVSVSVYMSICVFLRLCV